MAALNINKTSYDKYISNNFYLSAIAYDEEGLYLVENDKVTKKVPFLSHDDLAKLPFECYTQIKDAKQFLDILDINNSCKSDIEKAKMNEDMTLPQIDEDMPLPQKVNISLLPIRFILMKQQSSFEEDQTIINFIIKYNKLITYNGYLEEEANITMKQMGSLLNDALQINTNNNALLIIKQYIDSLHNGTNNDFINSLIGNGSSMNKDSALTRINPNAPSVISDDLNMNSYGFFSFMGLLYIAFNLLITLVILAIKK